MIDLDEDDQPLNRLLNRKRLNDRAIDELIGLAKGIIADNVVVLAEAEFLLAWMENNVKFHDDRIINVLYARIRDMLADNYLDPNEQEELLEMLKGITGKSCVGDGTENTVATLPLDTPPPQIILKDSFFCLTGKFAYAPRKVCQNAIKTMGGRCQKNPINTTDYLVIGTLCSRDWIHSTYGRKIEKAMEIRASFKIKPRKTEKRLSIIHEDHWIKFLDIDG